ncbi:unnamed protein product, partial [Ixodes pacificus]
MHSLEPFIKLWRSVADYNLAITHTPKDNSPWVVDTIRNFFNKCIDKTILEGCLNMRSREIEDKFEGCCLMPGGLITNWFDNSFQINKSGAKLIIQCKDVLHNPSETLTFEADDTKGAIMLYRQSSPEREDVKYPPTIQYVFIPKNDGEQCVVLDADKYVAMELLRSNDFDDNFKTHLRKLLQIAYPNNSLICRIPTYIFPSVFALANFCKRVRNSKYLDLYNSLFMHPLLHNSELFNALAIKMDPIFGLEALRKKSGLLRSIANDTLKFPDFSLGLYYLSQVQLGGSVNDLELETIAIGCALSLIPYRVSKHSVSSNIYMYNQMDHIISSVVVGLNDDFPYEVTISMRFSALIWLYKAMITRKFPPVTNSISSCKNNFMYVCYTLFGDMKKSETYKETTLLMNERITRALLLDSECGKIIHALLYNQSIDDTIQSCHLINNDKGLKRLFTTIANTFKTTAPYPTWTNVTEFFLKRLSQNTNSALCEIISKNDWSVGYSFKSVYMNDTMYDNVTGVDDIYLADGNTTLKHSRNVFVKMSLIERLLVLYYSASSTEPKLSKDVDKHYTPNIDAIEDEIYTFSNDDYYIAYLKRKGITWSHAILEVIFKCLQHNDSATYHIQEYMKSMNIYTIHTTGWTDMKKTMAHTALTAIKHHQSVGINHSNNKVKLNDLDKYNAMGSIENYAPILHQVNLIVKHLILPNSHFIKRKDELKDLHAVVAVYAMRLLNLITLKTSKVKDFLYFTTKNSTDDDLYIRTRYLPLPKPVASPFFNFISIDERTLFDGKDWYSIDAITLSKMSYRALINDQRNIVNLIYTCDGSGFARFLVFLNDGTEEFFLYNKYKPFCHSNKLLSKTVHSVWNIFQGPLWIDKKPSTTLEDIESIKEVFKLQDDFAKEESLIYGAAICPKESLLFDYSIVTTSWLETKALPYISHFYIDYVLGLNIKEVAKYVDCIFDSDEHTFSDTPNWLSEACNKVRSFKISVHNGKYLVFKNGITPRLLTYMVWKYVAFMQRTHPIKDGKNIYATLLRTPYSASIRRKLFSVNDNKVLIVESESLRDAYFSRKLLTHSTEDIIRAIAVYVYCVGAFDVTTTELSLDYQTSYGNLKKYYNMVMNRYGMNNLIQVVMDVVYHIYLGCVLSVPNYVTREIHQYDEEIEYTYLQLEVTDCERLYDFI